MPELAVLAFGVGGQIVNLVLESGPVAKIVLGVLVVFSALLLLSVKVVAGWRSTYTSLIPFARSASTSS